MPAVRRFRLPITIAVILIATSIALFFLFNRKESAGGDNASGPITAQPAAPPDLAKFRRPFVAGAEALQQGDADTAIRELSSFTFGSHAVEEYRLYFLANAYQLKGNGTASRRTLARLWRLDPQLVYRADVAFTLAAAYRGMGSWRQASDVYGTLPSKLDTPQLEAVARASYIETKFYAGDPGAMLLASFRTIIEDPATAQAAAAEKLVRSVASVPDGTPLPLSAGERVERARNLITAGNPQMGLDELATLDIGQLPLLLREEVTLQKGLALQALHRTQDSTVELEKLSSGSYQHALPALHAAAHNYRALAAAVNPVRYRTITQKVKAGTKKVRKKGQKKPVLQTVFKTVKKQEKYIDAAAQAKKDSYEKLSVERLKDTLLLPAPRDTRLEILQELLTAAQQKNQFPYMRELVQKIVAIDQSGDPALQVFWDRAWAAWMRGDLAAAKDELDFIRTTYGSPNVRRQSTYWYARTIERQGERARARGIYLQLADAPYQDLYALFASQRTGYQQKTRHESLTATKDNWPSYAEAKMPADLRLAYQLTALGLPREARLEVQVHANSANRTYADAILGELYFTSGATVLSHRFLRRSFIKLGSVEQDEVPRHFLEMYYPIRYHDHIRDASGKRGVDPYLIMALIHQESGFNPVARSPVGARGLMQLMPATAREIGGKIYGLFTEGRLDDPKVNIQVGCYYVKQLLDMFKGNEQLTAAGYNGGPYRIRAWRARNPHQPLDEFIEGLALSETRNYVKRVTLLRSSYATFYPVD